MHCAFPDLLVLFKLALTVPVASASAECSFSAMRRIKSHLRASMPETRTSDLSLISVERELSNSIKKNPSCLVDAFASMGKRRLILL
jgi:hAT family C-terminal dimerisation region